MMFIVLLFVAIVATINVTAFTSTMPMQRFARPASMRQQALSMVNEPTQIKSEPTQIKITEIYSTPKVAEEEVIPNYDNETEEERYKRTKLAEIAEKQALEVFVSRNTGKWECQSCGYVYSEAQGNEKYNIKAGTPFDQIEKFRCPQVRLNYTIESPPHLRLH